MKGSVITSAVLHGLLLAFLLVHFGSPEPFEITAGEAMPVELVPIEELTQLQEGDKEAPKDELSSKEITKREAKVEEAINSGDNDFDLKSVPTPMEKPSNIQKAAAPEKSEQDSPDKDVTPVDVADVIKEETAVEPETEVAALPEPVVDVKPEPRPEPEPEPEPKVVEEKPVEETAESLLPENVPVPVSKPKVAEVKKVEEKKEEKKPEKTADKKKQVEVAEAKTDKNKNAKKDKEDKKSAKSTTKKESDFNADEINDLLSKVDTTAGGAKRSTKKKSFGADKATGGAKLSQDEMNALKGLIEKNWSIMPGQVTSSDIIITVRMQLDISGEIVGDLEVTSKGGDPAARTVLESSARRAVKKSAPFDILPKDKYDTWSEVVVNFNPSELM